DRVRGHAGEQCDARTKIEFSLPGARRVVRRTRDGAIDACDHGALRGHVARTVPSAMKLSLIGSVLLAVAACTSRGPRPAIEEPPGAHTAAPRHVAQGLPIDSSVGGIDAAAT